MTTTTYAPGALCALVGARTLLVLAASPSSELVRTAWPVVEADVDLDVLLARLLGIGVAGMPPLGLVHDAAGVTTVIVRGPITAVVRCADGRSEQVSGERVATWSERVFEGVLDVTVGAGPTTSDAATLPIGSGIILAGTAVRRCGGAVVDAVAPSRADRSSWSSPASADLVAATSDGPAYAALADPVAVASNGPAHAPRLDPVAVASDEPVHAQRLDPVAVASDERAHAPRLDPAADSAASAVLADPIAVDRPADVSSRPKDPDAAVPQRTWSSAPSAADPTVAPPEPAPMLAVPPPRSMRPLAPLTPPAPAAPVVPPGGVPQPPPQNGFSQPAPAAPPSGFAQPTPGSTPGRLLIDRLDLATIGSDRDQAAMPVFEPADQQRAFRDAGAASGGGSSGDHDARTRPSLRPGGQPQPQSQSPTKAELRVYAVMCVYGHANPPTAVACRVCAQPIDEDQVPTEIPQPTVGRLRQLSTGASHPLRGLVLVGREPRLERRDTTLGDASSLAEVSFFAVDSPENLVSRTHVELRVTGWMVEVIDVSSSQTEVTMPGQTPVRLRPDQPTTIVPGAQLLLADEITLQFEVTG